MSFDLHRPVAVGMAGVVVVLVAASALIFALGRLRPQFDLREVRLRLRSWWAMVAIFAVALLLDRVVSIVFFCLLSLMAFREYVGLVTTRVADRRVLLWAFLAIPVQYIWIGLEEYGMFLIWVPIYLFLLLPLRMVLIGETEGFLRAVGTVHWGLMTTVFSIGHVAYLLVLPQDGSGAALVLFLVFLTQFNDVAQYVWGRTLGQRRVLPRVSPGKTVAGLLGGVTTTAVLSRLIAPYLTPLTELESWAAGVLIGCAGFIGDVVISAIKRDVGAKDSGSLLPGHGGLLDRLDSLTYTAPLFFHFVRYLHF